MKKMRCNKCVKDYAIGKFCPECGQPLQEVVTLDVKFKEMSTGRQSETLIKDTKRWLNRIGVQTHEVKISRSGNSASVQYSLMGKKYVFTSTLQQDYTNNLAAVEQFVHYRVLSIEYGIESVEKAFAGYDALPDYTGGQTADPYQQLGFKGKVPIEEARAKFKELAKRYHPDLNKNEGTWEEFNRLKAAMDTIEKEHQ